jgi:hypothetical protein
VTVPGGAGRSEKDDDVDVDDYVDGQRQSR